MFTILQKNYLPLPQEIADWLKKIGLMGTLIIIFYQLFQLSSQVIIFTLKNAKKRKMRLDKHFSIPRFLKKNVLEEFDVKLFLLNYFVELKFFVEIVPFNFSKSLRRTMFDYKDFAV